MLKLFLLMLLLACKRFLKKTKSIYIIKGHNSYMKTFVNKAGVLLVAVVIAGKVIFFPAQALANQNPTFDIDFNQIKNESFLPEQMSLEEITDKISGYTTADRALIVSMYYGVDYAKEQTEKGIMINPFGNEFDYVLAPNPTGNLILNSLGAVLTNIGNSPMDIKDNYENIDKLRVNELWCHSQGCDTFINWANAGKLKVKKVYLTGAPMASGFGYIKKLIGAAARAGVEKIFIYQNLGDEENPFDDDYVTRIKFPSLRQIDDPKSIKVGIVWEVGNENLETKVKIKFFELYTSHGKNESYTKDGVEFFKIYGVPASGHGIERYYENIKAIQ